MNPPDEGEPPDFIIFKRRLLFQGLLVTALVTPPAIYLAGVAGSLFAAGFLISGLLIYILDPSERRSFFIRLLVYACFLAVLVKAGPWYLGFGVAGLLLPWGLLMLVPVFEKWKERES